MKNNMPSPQDPIEALIERRDTLARSLSELNDSWWRERMWGVLQERLEAERITDARLRYDSLPWYFRIFQTRP